MDTLGHRDARGLVPLCGRIADSGYFQGFIYGVILANAVVLGMTTYPGIEDRQSHTLNVLNEVFLGIFVVELVIRIVACGRRPQDFFRNAWNVFDFVVISLAFVPALRKSATLVRLARLLRVVRLASVREDLRAVAVGMVRSIPAIASLLVMVTLVVYFYAMVGWVMFHTEDPQHWGTIGQSMLTLFTVSTLEGWNVILYEGQQIEPLAWLFFVSFVLLISFLVINIVMGIMMNSIEQARESGLSPRKRAPTSRIKLEARLTALREALAGLEAERAREEEEQGQAFVEERARVDARLELLHSVVQELEDEIASQADADEDDEDLPRLARRGGRAF